MYDVYHGMVPDIFEGMFVYINMIHYHDTRISGHLHHPTISTYLSQNSVRYHGVIIWNKILTAAINPDSSEVPFKIMLKKRNPTEGYNSFLLNSEYCYYKVSVPAQFCTLHPSPV